MSKELRLGIMGGTFDPVHFGHLVTAEEALVQFQLDRVVFMPAGRPARKEHVPVSSPEDRYLMCVLATASNPDFEVSRLEVDRPGLTYTVDTVRVLRDIHPDAQLFFITGADAVLEILTWKDAEVFKELCTFIAATRPGHDVEHFTQELREVEHAPRIEWMEVPALAISSTDIRRRVIDDMPIRYLLPESVASYLRKRGLYRGSVA